MLLSIGGAMVEERSTREGMVLLHGAGLGKWIWHDVAAMLGEGALPIDLPGRGGGGIDLRELSFDDYVESVLNEMERSTFERFVVVGHSIAGLLALRVATLLRSNVKSVVLIGGAVSSRGRSYAESLPFFSRTMLRFFALMYPRGLRAPDGVIKKALAHDLTPQQTTTLLERFVPEAPALFLDPVAWSPPSTITYVRMMGDRSDLSPALQARMADRLGAHAKRVDLDGGHLPMLSRPNDLAAILKSELG
ncbi:MAG: alpha/beta fold hydrolase [Myxococcota bacterium]